MTGKPIDSTWSLNQYRNAYDSQEVWELKRSFMQKYQKIVPETALVSLAQTMINIEVLRCRYPDDTMELIEKMGAKMLKRFRNQRKNRIERTFVDASAAARSKMSQNEEPVNIKTTVENGEEQDSLDEEDELSFAAAREFVKNNTVTEENELQYEFKFANTAMVPVSPDRTKRERPTEDECIEPKRINIEDPFSNKFGRLLLYKSEINGNEYQTIMTSAAKCRIPFRLEKSTLPGCELKQEIFLNDLSVASGIHMNSRIARDMAVENALEVLSHMYYTLRQKARYILKDGQAISKEQTTTAAGGLLDFKDKELGHNNFGFRLLKSMGWSGGGLGQSHSSTGGIVEPISVSSSRIGRQGLGLESPQSQVNFNDILDKFNRSAEDLDLAFDESFSKDERRCIHRIASRLNLKSKTFTNPNSPGGTLVISKDLDIFTIASILLSEYNDGDAVKAKLLLKYELIPPQPKTD